MSDELRAPPTKTRWLIFALACGLSFLLYLHRYTWGIVKAALSEEYGWDKTTLGYLDSAFMFSYSLGQIPGGMLGDWFGPRTVLTLMILFWSGGMAGMVFARNLIGMIFFRLLFGLGQAGCYPNLSKITKAWFPPDVRSAIQGWVASFSGRMGGAVSYAL
ncbi:MAG: MFS transporter, partial [Planctomycetaceae bacterium]|nr:MFS transporter [Planctomycetaceae bacterium]